MSRSYTLMPGQSGSGPHCFKIATLPANNASDDDHLHLVANLNYSWVATANASIDALFGNRGGFTYSYSGRGVSVNPSAKLVAYQNADTTVDIYLQFTNDYTTASYTVLETTEDVVYTNPGDLGATAPTGTLVFDSSNPSYPPSSFVSFGGRTGLNTSGPQSIFHVVDNVGIAASNATAGPFGSANVAIQSSYGARTPGIGAALSFAFPANADGSNVWEQARILGTPDVTASANAQGRLYLQTRYSVPNAWAWNNNLILASDGSSTFGGNVKLTPGSGSSITFQDNSVQSVAWTGVLSGGDYAESVDVAGDSNYEPGDVLVVDPGVEGRFFKSAQPYSTAVTGVYSTRPGVVGRRQKTDKSHMKEEVPMAMTGIVPTKVSAENGPIRPGDLLVTSSKPGYAMKGTDRSQMLGAVIGKSLGHLDGGTGVIEVVITLQ